MDLEYGVAPSVTALLNDKGWPVAGVFIGGCQRRGVGSSFHAAAHTHTKTEPVGWICIRSPKRVLSPSGEPSRLLRHEVAHVLAPKASHGTRAFIAALAQVGLATDPYSRAGRKRAARG